MAGGHKQASLIGGNCKPSPRIPEPPAVSLLLLEFLRQAGMPGCVDTGKQDDQQL